MSFTESFLVRGDNGFEVSPFSERIGHSNGVVCFESDAARESVFRRAASDLAALNALALGDCYYGAASYRIEPFVGTGDAVTATALLRSLRVRNFRSEHISSLESSEIAYPGYRPDTRNDEVHSDPSGQKLFYKPGYDVDQDEELEDDPELREGALASESNHRALRSLVQGPLWYVLLHEDAGDHCRLVALFAVGRSLSGEHLIGVASQQVCHNLCD